MHRYAHTASTRRGEKGTEKIYEETMADIYLKTLIYTSRKLNYNKINTEIHRHYHDKNAESQKRENLESSKKKNKLSLTRESA